MVDFKEENAHLYVPKNLSYEFYDFSRIHRDSLILRALQLSKRDRLIQKALEAQQQNQQFKTNRSHVVKAFTPEEKTKIRALDLAIDFSKSNNLYVHFLTRSAKDFQKFLLKKDLNMHHSKSVDNYNDNRNKSNVNNTDSKPKSSRPQSPTSNLLEADTVFSEDYMRMADVGYSSDLASLRSDSLCSSEGECSAMAHCDRGSADSALQNEDDDLDRVTIDFSHCMGLTETEVIDIPDTKPAINIPHSTAVDINNKNTNKSNSPLVKKRLKEKELPKIKLLLSQSPVSVNVLEKGLPNLPDESPDDSPDNSPPASSGSLFINQEFDFLESEKVKRSTSLKTYKTPPGTPHRKKVVRFADAMGLDLEDVKTVMNMEDPPEIPESAMKDLQIGLEEEHKTEGTKYLCACFPQPGANVNFIQRIIDNKVMLENCLVDGFEMTINGTVRVANITFHKRVLIRYTVNNWMTFTDVPACYVQNSNDGATDRFSFTIGIPNYFQIGDKLKMAVMFDAGGHEYWDSNGGGNYVVECYATAVPVLQTDNTWMNFL